MFKIEGDVLLIEFDGLNTNIVKSDSDLIFKGNNVKSILNYSCICYGSSLNGRIRGSKWALKSKYKLPIVISEKEKLLFFPVNEMWINFAMIEDVKRKNDGVEVLFKNGLKREFNVSYTIFNNQVLKSSRLWIIFLS